MIDTFEKDNTIYYEVQRFYENRLSYIIYGVFLSVFIFAIVNRENLIKKEGGLISFIVPLSVLFLAFVWTLLFKFEIKVRDKSILFRFFPLHFKFKKFDFKDIEGVELIEFNPILDFGGWGIRRGKGMWAYILVGNRGVVFSLKDGRKFLIGSKNPEMFFQMVSQNR